MSYKVDKWVFQNLIEWEYKYVGWYGAKGEKRAPKQKRTPEAIAKQNLYNKQKTVRHLLNANFQKGDYWTTLTYERGTTLPIGEVAHDVQLFIDRLKRFYKKTGEACKFIYRLEIGANGGIHAHIVLNRIEGLDLAIQDKWPHGFTHTELLDNGPYEQLAEYIVKPPTDQQGKLLTALGLSKKDEKRLIKYSCSRNLIRPEPETYEVKNHTMRKIYNSDLVPTDGYFIDRDSIQRGVNEWNGMSFLKYREHRLTDKQRAAPIRICECPHCHQFTLEKMECRCRFEVRRIRKRRRRNG